MKFPNFFLLCFVSIFLSEISSYNSLLFILIFLSIIFSLLSTLNLFKLILYFLFFISSKYTESAHVVILDIVLE